MTKSWSKFVWVQKNGHCPVRQRRRLRGLDSRKAKPEKLRTLYRDSTSPLAATSLLVMQLQYRMNHDLVFCEMLLPVFLRRPSFEVAIQPLDYLLHNVGTSITGQSPAQKWKLACYGETVPKTKLSKIGLKFWRRTCKKINEKFRMKEKRLRLASYVKLCENCFVYRQNTERHPSLADGIQGSRNDSCAGLSVRYRAFAQNPDVLCLCVLFACPVHQTKS